MLAPCVCVRECAPERGGARRNSFAFFGKFWAEQVLGCSSTRRQLDGAERLRSDLCASRRCAGSARCTNCGTHVGLLFFWL